MRLISPEALVWWRLNPRGWTGQAARTTTVHGPRVSGCNCSTSGMHGKGCLQDTVFKLPSHHKINAFRTLPISFSFYRSFYNVPEPVLHHFIVLWFCLLTREGLSNFFLMHPEKNSFTLILVLLYQGQSLRLLCFYLQAHLTAINQKHSYSASHCISWWLHGGLMWGLFVLPFQIEAFHQLKILEEGH